jgi:transposase
VTRAEKVAEAKRLKAEGLRHREIAERFGCTTSAVTKMLNPNVTEWNRRDSARPERKAAKAQWNRDNPPRCPECGRPKGNHTKLCQDCWDAHESERLHARATRIVDWWAEGLSLREIGARLGWTANHVQVQIHKLRAAGYPLPYRYRWNRKVAA